MDRFSPGRALFTSMGVVLTACLALLAASPAALASVHSTAHLKYRIIGLNYRASGALGGGRNPGACTGIASWEGTVETKAEADLLSTSVELVHLTIDSHGTHGGGTFLDHVVAKSDYKADHRITTACKTDEGVESETAFTKTPCGRTVNSELITALHISGGVGSRVAVRWTFTQVDGASGSLVPDFTCMERFDFPEHTATGGLCTTASSLAALNKRFVTLPFKCHYETSVPPSGVTGYYASADATGTMKLKKR